MEPIWPPFTENAMGEIHPSLPLLVHFMAIINRTHPHPARKRSSAKGVAAHTSHGAGLISVRPIFGRNGGVGLPASGGLGGSASPNGTRLSPKQHTQQSIGDEERLSWVEDGWGSFD